MKPHVVSISWGFPEANLSKDDRDALQSLLGKGEISWVAASGDDLADGGNVFFPASSDAVISCGGTQISLSPDGKTIQQQTVWSNGVSRGSGGGISRFVPVPDYQTKVTLPTSTLSGNPGRGLPDVAAAAAGYQIVIKGQPAPISGTSAAAPLWAALIAMANAQRDASPIGQQFLASLYSTPQLYCDDRITGSNVADAFGYYANGRGWNACTGWGTPLPGIVDALKRI